MPLYSALIYLCLLCAYVHSSLPNPKKDLTVLYQWKQLEFDYPTPYDRQVDIQNGNFIPSQAVPIDTDIYYGDDGFNKIFVTIPRFQTGIPATIGVIYKKFINGNPVISPYPSWGWHKNLEQCNNQRIVSVFRITIDECGRLWILDAGRLLEKIICPPQVLIFDLKTDRLIHRYEIPSTQIEDRSTLVTPVVEVLDKRSQCINTFAYLADCQTNSIIVYDLKRDTSWKVTDKTMYPHPDYGTYTIQGESFELMDGILGMSLSPVTQQPRKLYYHAMSSPAEHWVYTSYLKNQSLFTNSTPPQLFNTFRNKRKTQVPAEAMDSNGVMYFGLVSDVQIACYNTRKGEYGDFTSSDIVVDNPVTLQFASGIKVVRNRRGEEELWILTPRFQKVSVGSLNLNEINFRIQAIKIKDLIYGTNCMEGGNYKPSIPQYNPAGGYGIYNLKNN